MDKRLFNSAQLGDLDQLKTILKEDHSSLENSKPLSSGETLLHIATLAGKSEYVKELMRLKPCLARETNKEGLTPLHIACARGNVRIVKELLKVSPNLCLVKDKGTRTSLHYASMKGRVNVIKELISKCPESAKEVTDKGETPLHLAVKNSQFEALKALIEALGDKADTMLLNAKDAEGQTVLQVAIAKNQLQACKLLSKDNPTTKDVLSHVDERNELKHRIIVHQKDDEKAKDEEKKETKPARAVLIKNVSRGLDKRAAFVASVLARVTYTTGLSPFQYLWTGKNVMPRSINRSKF